MKSQVISSALFSLTSSSLQEYNFRHLSSIIDEIFQLIFLPLENITKYIMCFLYSWRRCCKIVSLLAIIWTLAQTDGFYQWILCNLVNLSSILSGSLCGMSSCGLISTIAHSSSITSTETFFVMREPWCFFVDEPGRLGGKITSQITRTCLVSNPIPACSGTYPSVSSMIGATDAVTMSFLGHVAVMEIEMTIL